MGEAAFLAAASFDAAKLQDRKENSGKMRMEGCEQRERRREVRTGTERIVKL